MMEDVGLSVETTILRVHAAYVLYSRFIGTAVEDVQEPTMFVLFMMGIASIVYIGLVSE